MPDANPKKNYHSVKRTPTNYDNNDGPLEDHSSKLSQRRSHSINHNAMTKSETPSERNITPRQIKTQQLNETKVTNTSYTKKATQNYSNVKFENSKN